MEDAVTRIRSRCELARQHSAAILVRHCVFIVRGQQMTTSFRARVRRPRCLPIRLTVDRHSRQLARHALACDLGFGSSESRPPREVANRRRPVAREIASRELRERFVARSRRCGGQPFVREHERLLLARARAETDEPFVRMPPQQVQAAAAASRDASALESSIQIGPRYTLSALQRLDQHFAAASDEATVDPVLLFESARVARQCPRRAQAQHPACIFRGDKVQRAAQRPGANDRAIGDGSFDCGLGCRAGAQADRPERAEVVLRLERAEPANGRGRAGELLMTNALLAHALGGELDGRSSGGRAAQFTP